jgi:hypothetical protein
MSQTAVLDRQEAMAWAIEFLDHLIDEVLWSSDDELAATCALAERFQPDAIVGYTTIDSRGPVPIFQTAVYPRLPTWPSVSSTTFRSRDPMWLRAPQPLGEAYRGAGNNARILNSLISSGIGRTSGEELISDDAVYKG